METKFKLKPVDFDPFIKGNMAKAIPVTESQQEIWLACALGGNDANCSYNQSVTVQLTGRLAMPALESAIHAVVDRHEALRSSFSRNGEHMFVYNGLEPLINHHDLSLDLNNQQALLAGLAVLDSGSAFDLEKGPLIRFHIVKLSDSTHLLRFTAHHIICDGWSLGVLLEELSGIYSASITGSFARLQKPDSLRAFVMETAGFLQTDEYRDTETYWTQKFSDGGPVVELPVDRPRPPIRTYNGNRIDVLLEQHLVEKIKGLGSVAGANFVTTMLATFELFLHGLTSQEALVIGLPAAGQAVTGRPGLVGHCVNFLPIRSKIDGIECVADYLKRRKTELLNDLDYQRITFGTLLKKVNVIRKPGYVPMTPLVFNVDMGMDGKASFAGLKHKLVSNPRSYENFELYLNITGSAETTALEWSYNTNLFDERTIRQWIARYIDLLDRCADNPYGKVSQIGWKAPERLAENNTETLDHEKPSRSSSWWADHHFQERAIDVSLPMWIESSFRRYKDQVAIVFGQESVTYHELFVLSNKYAVELKSMGVKPGDRVGLSLYRGIDLVATILAIVRIGSAYVPLDITFPKQRLKAITDQADLKWIIVQQLLADQYDNHQPIATLEEFTRKAAMASGEVPLVDLPNDFVAYVLHTSGSTGKPKGVAMGQRALSNLLIWQRDHSEAGIETKTLQFAPITFDVSFQEIFSTLTTGGTLCLITEEMRYDIPELLRHIDKERIHRIFLPFVALHALAEYGCSSGIYPRSLREVITAGEQLKVTETIVNFFSFIPGATLSNQYGPTETHVVTALKMTGPPASWPTLPAIGKPVTNTRIHLLNADLAPVTDAEIGELFVEGLSLAAGYIGAPNLTSERFFDISHNSKSVRVYRTGDLAKYDDDGNLIFLGRGDAQVKIRGYRVELGEIESLLTKLDGIGEAVVVLGNDTIGIPRLVAYVSLKDKQHPHPPTSAPQILEHAISESRIKHWKSKLSAFFPDYMIPHAIVAISHFPLTRSGKIDRLALPPVTAMLSPETQREKDFVAPRTVTERLIAEIWQNTLGLETVGINDDFFESGGYSLIAVKVMLAIERQLGIRLPLSSLFENPTIAKLAKLVSGDEEQIKWDALVPIQTNGTKPPIYLVHGGGLNVLVFQSMAKYLDPDQPVYALQALGLDGAEIQARNIEEIAAHYLKEIFTIDSDGPFYLAGYSLGGKIVFEMAKQLLDRGKTLGMIGIFDTIARSPDEDGKGMTWIMRKTARQFRKIPYFLKQLAVFPRETIGYQAYRTAALLKGIFGRQPGEVECESFAYDSNVAKIYQHAYDTYSPPALPITIDLFRVKKRLYYTDDRKYLGWKRFALQGVNIHEVEGDHKTFILPPHDKELATVLQRALVEAKTK